MADDLRPTFLGIGAPRSGTTALHHLLSRHPDVWVPEGKEVHFFTYGHPEVTRGEGSWEGYLRLFSPAAGHMARGEVSPSYLWVPGTARRIALNLPEVHLFAILRSPVERAISDFQYSWKYGVNQMDALAFFRQGVDEVEAENLEVGPFTPSSVVWKGLYAVHLAEYLDVLSAEKIQLFLLDDLASDPSAVRKELFDHLGVDDRPELTVEVRNARERAEQVPAEVHHLLVEFYRESVDVLEQLLDRDLSAWLEVPRPTS